MEEVQIPPEPVARLLAVKIGDLTLDNASREIHVAILSQRIQELRETLDEKNAEIAQLEEELGRGGTEASGESEPDDDEEADSGPEGVRSRSTESGGKGKKKGTQRGQSRR